MLCFSLRIMYNAKNKMQEEKRIFLENHYNRDILVIRT